ncbi:MAG: hypothetical protein OSJ31_06110 [Alistipes sp.]|nr:hypothetical protein [Alistipes sp.]
MSGRRVLPDIIAPYIASCAAIRFDPLRSSAPEAYSIRTANPLRRHIRAASGSMRYCVCRRQAPPRPVGQNRHVINIAIGYKKKRPEDPAATFSH